MRVNSYEYACLIDQFWFEYGLHVSSSRIQIFESLFCSLLSRPSLACMLLQVAITLFSPAHPHAHFMFLLSSQTWSHDVSLEKCHTLPIITHYTVFIISHVSTVLWYHSVPKLSFPPPHTQSPLVFHFVFLSMGFSHTPYMSLHMTHTTKITLSLSCRHNICCGLLFVSIPD